MATAKNEIGIQTLIPEVSSTQQSHYQKVKPDALVEGRQMKPELNSTFQSQIVYLSDQSVPVINIKNRESGQM